METKKPNNVVIISYSMYNELRNKYDNLEMSYNLLESDYESILKLCMDFQDRLLKEGLLEDRVLEVNDIKIIEEINVNNEDT